MSITFRNWLLFFFYIGLTIFLNISISSAFSDSYVLVSIPLVFILYAFSRSIVSSYGNHYYDSAINLLSAMSILCTLFYVGVIIYIIVIDSAFGLDNSVHFFYNCLNLFFVLIYSKKSIRFLWDEKLRLHKINNGGV